MKQLSSNSKILVVGLGKLSGLSACNFLVKKGFIVYASDNKTEKELNNIMAALDSRVIVFAANQKPEILNEGFDLIVLSPGVPKNIPLVKAAYEKKIPVIAEVELGYRYMKGKMAAITGTDGKSTTTSLVGHIFKEMGYKTFTGGNLGIPFISYAEKTSDDSISVLELSSFQLETIDEFRPDVAVILNVTPDHLDRYTGMDEYFTAKLRIAKNQSADDYFIYNQDSKLLSGSLDGISAKKLCFSLHDKNTDAWFENDSIFIRQNDRIRKVLDTSKMKIMGIHNVENSMASVLTAVSLLEKKGDEINFEQLEQSCYSFSGLEHRMEEVGIFEGRRFINDSKATTVNAVEMAVRSIPAGSILIMGGRTKGDDYSRLAKTVKNKIKHLVLIGESAAEFKKLFRDVPVSIADTMEAAVRNAFNKSKEGDVILLSPGCASFDMYSNFEERGNVFKKSVKKLKGEVSCI